MLGNAGESERSLHFGPPQLAIPVAIASPAGGTSAGSAARRRSGAPRERPEAPEQRTASDRLVIRMRRHTKIRMGARSPRVSAHHPCAEFRELFDPLGRARMVRRSTQVFGVKQT